MVKKYFIQVLLIHLLLPITAISQEIKIFSTTDFDLNGKVKTCLVNTKYGKEEYVFNQNGLLTKSVTRFNESNYDITYYKYLRGKLLEKRFENYRDNTFNATSSIANVYSIDSTNQYKITEKIVSYENQFLDQYEYFFLKDTISKIVHTNNHGIDETVISHAYLKGEMTKTYALNGVLKKTVCTSFKKQEDSILSTTVLTKKYLDGLPNSAVEEVFNHHSKIANKIYFFYDLVIKQFAEKFSEHYFYDDTGMLLKMQIKQDDSTTEKEYLYQFDANGNWIKEIITPENTYKTRKISYYNLEENVEKE